MKKLISLLLALAMVLSLAACGAKNDAPAASNPPAAQSAETQSDADEKEKEPAPVETKPTMDTETVEQYGRQYIDFYNALYTEDFEAIYDLTTYTEADEATVKELMLQYTVVAGIVGLSSSYRSAEYITTVNGYDCILVYGTTVTRLSTGNFAERCIIKDGLIVNDTFSIDSQTYDQLSNAYQNFYDNSSRVRDWVSTQTQSGGAAATTNNTNAGGGQRMACGICGGSGVQQQVIGVDGNGLPQYMTVGCGGCGGSGYVG